MAREQMWTTQPTLNRGALAAAGILIGAGALVSMAGAAVGLSAVIAGLRHHVKASEMAPSELAMHHWKRAKSAAQAGADAWRVHDPAQYVSAQRARGQAETRSPVG